MSKLHWTCSILLCVAMLGGCYSTILHPTKTPIDAIWYERQGPAKHEQLFVFLHGDGDKINVFDRKGLIQAVKSRKLAVDMVAVDNHIGYYLNGTIITRLKADVIDPARASGYKKIWLIGNSLGGLGAISYVRENPGEITGLVLLGPYLGRKRFVKMINRAGGLEKYAEDDKTEDSAQENWERRFLPWFKDDQQKAFWRWLGHYEFENGCFHRIFIGYGENDRYSGGQRLAASILPQDQVFAIEGGHDWPTWKKLWELILDTKFCCEESDYNSCPNRIRKKTQAGIR